MPRKEANKIMYSKKITYLLLGSLFICCDSAFVDTLQKCDVTDEKCVTALYTGSLAKIGTTGIPDLNIPPIEPLEVKNFTVSVLELLEVTLVEATVKGITDCVYSTYKVNLQEKRGLIDITCDSITIEGHYKIASGPLLKSLMGDVVHADGHGKLVFEKIHISNDFSLTIEKDDKGIIYFKPNNADTTHTFEVLQKATVEADNLYLGSQEISKVAVTFFNETWNHLIKSLGKFFSEKAIALYFDYIGRFFNSVPANKYLTNDFTPYV